MIGYEEYYDECELRNDNVDESLIDEQGNDEVDDDAREAVVMENNVVENNLVDKCIPNMMERATHEYNFRSTARNSGIDGGPHKN